MTPSKTSGLRPLCHALAAVLVVLCVSHTVHAIDLTDEEKAYLRRKETIIFVSQTRYPPFEFTDRNLQREGMMLDVVRWMAVEMGFQPVFIDTAFQEAQEAALSGKADVLTSLFHSEKRKEKFEFTDTLFEVPASIFVKAERTDIKDVKDLEGKTVAIQRGDYAGDFLESQGIRFDTLDVANFAAAVDMVVEGRADAVIGDEQIVLFHIFSNRLTGHVKKVGEPLYIGKNCMASNKDKPILVHILNKGVHEARKSGMLDKISTKWLGTKYGAGETFLERYLWPLSAAAGGLLTLSLGVWAWNVRLRSLVRKKTEVIVSREKALMESENKFKGFAEQALAGIYVIQDGIFVYANPKFAQMFGYTIEECLDHMPFKRLVQAEDQAKVQEQVRKRISGETEFVHYTFRGRKKDGQTVHAEVYGSTILYKERPAAAGTILDITERKKAEERLRESEERYRRLTETINDWVWEVDDQARYTYISPRVRAILGYEPEDLLGRTPFDFMDAEEALRVRGIFEDVAAEKRPFNGMENTCRHRNGRPLVLETSGAPILGADGNLLGYRGVDRDITGRKQAEAAQEAALQEKEVLLREVHHRVKNNMQVISSLLTLQAERVENEQARGVLFESRQRVLAMAMIHEVLYGGENLAAIDLSDYLGCLIQHLQGVYGSHGGVSITLDMEKAELSIDQAVPCGLILNELITNAFKHGFPDSGEGSIRIQVRIADGKEMILEVRDDGVGLPPGLELEKPASLGLKLVQGLLEHQLDGTLEVDLREGTVFTLRWPLLVEKGESL